MQIVKYFLRFFFFVIWYHFIIIKQAEAPFLFNFNQK